MLRAGTLSWLVVGCLTVSGTAGAGGLEASEAPERESLRLCEGADLLDGEARREMLDRALRLAEGAVQRGPERADAHFAVFCALGKQLNDSGLGFGTLGAVRRVRAAVDRTLELQPDHVDALLGKARMLLRLPRMLGGDAKEARRCVERAYRYGPEHPVAAAMWRETGPEASVVAAH